MNNKAIIGSELILTNTKAYGKDIINSVFPSPIDGMKKVHRRIVWSVKDISGKLSGDALVSYTRRYHPHGELSIYDAATKLGQSFRQQCSLLDILGDDGTYGGDSPASARYNEFKLSNITKDIFIKGIDFDTLPMMKMEDLSGYEPEYFIPKIPTALLLANSAVGFGFTSSNFSMKLDNICKLTEAFLLAPDRSTWRPQPKLMLPYFPIWNRILNEDQLLREYSRRNTEASIYVEGRYEILSSSTFIIYTLAYGTDFASTRKNLISLMRNKKSAIAKLKLIEKPLSDHHNYAKYQITVKNQNIFEVIDILKKTLNISGAVHPVNNYTLHGELVTYDTVNLIAAWYKERFRSILNAKRSEQVRLNDKLRVLEAYMIIANNVDEVIEFIKHHDTTEIYAYLFKQFGLSKYQSSKLMEAKIRTLSKRSRTDIEDEYSKLKEVYQKFLTTFDKIDDEILADVRAIGKKYKVDETYRGWPDTYIGVLQIVGSGSILFKNDSDLSKLAKIFKGRLQRVHTDKIVQIDQFGTTTKYTSLKNIPYTLNCNRCSSYPTGAKFVFVRKGIKTTLMPVTHIPSDDEVVSYVSDRPYCILKGGNIEQLSISSETDVKGMSFMFDSDTECLLVYYDLAEPKKIKLIKFTPGKKIALPLRATANVIGIASCSVKTYVNLPKNSKSRGWFIVTSKTAKSVTDTSTLPLREIV